MPGARYQNAARIRNSYPFYVSYGIRTSLAVASVTTDVETPFLFPSNVRMPFDTGPDKAPFVDVVINGCFVTFSSSAYAGLTVSGQIYHKTTQGYKTYLATYNGVYTALGTTATGPVLPLVLQPPIALPLHIDTDQTLNLGQLGFENIASVLGGQTLTFTIFLNIGLYPVYAETEWVKTICEAIRELQTPKWVKELDKSEPYQMGG